MSVVIALECAKCLGSACQNCGGLGQVIDRRTTAATPNPDAPIPFVPVKPPTRAQALRRIMRILDKLDTDDDRTAVLDALSLLWGPR